MFCAGVGHIIESLDKFSGCSEKVYVHIISCHFLLDYRGGIDISSFKLSLLRINIFHKINVSIPISIQTIFLLSNINKIIEKLM